MTTRVYLLGGYQTDFADNWARNGMEIADMMRHTVLTGLAETKLEPQDIEVAHVGNFAAELFCNQGHLGGLFAACDPAFAGLPASRHEGACASGSLAMLAASADIEAGRYGLAAVLGVEQMRNVPGEQAAQFIGGPAMWSGHEYQEARYPWPRVFSDVADEYDRRFGLKAEHLARIAEINFGNGRRNRNAQTRRWHSTSAASRRTRRQPDDRRPHAQAGLRPDHRWRRGRVPRQRNARARARQAARHRSRSVFRTSRAGDIARRRSRTPRKCRPAQVSPMCSRTCAAQ